MSKILVIEDNPDYRELLQNYLEDAGYDVAAFNDGGPAVEEIRRNKFDLVLLDIMLPQTDGYAAAGAIRKISGVPIIMLTALDSEAHQLRGFKLRVDDYVVKSISMPVLMQKVAAVLRRTAAEVNTAANPEAAAAGPAKPLRNNPPAVSVEDAEFTSHRLRLDIQRHTVTASGVPVEFTLLEFEILRELLKSEGKVVSRKYLLTKLWDYDYYGGERIVDTHIKNIRKKLGADDCIETVRDVGYKIPKAR